MFPRMLLVELNEILEGDFEHDISIYHNEQIWISHGDLVSEVVQSPSGPKSLELLKVPAGSNKARPDILRSMTWISSGL